LHPYTRWKFFDAKLLSLFGFYTKAPNFYDGAYTDPYTKKPVPDKSKMYILAVERKDLPTLKKFIKGVVGPLFRQKCIYFEVKGNVELVYSDREKIVLFP